MVSVVIGACIDMVDEDYDIKIVAFSDIHGDLEAFKEAIRLVKKLDPVDYILIAEDVAD